MYNNTNLALSQDFLTDNDFELITNSKLNDTLERIAERISLRNSILPYVKKAIINQDNGKTIEENTEIFNRLSECGLDIWIDNESGKIGTANFCKNRLCPVCNYRKSNKQWGKLYSVVESHKGKYKYLLITLTVENCKHEELSATIDDMLNSLHRFCNRKKWKRAVKGFARGLEITYNHTADTFHPHFHLLCAVEQDYFFNPDLYISASELTECWKLSANLNYRPSTDIRVVDNDKKAVAEVAKYALKMAEILQANNINSKRAKAVETLYTAIRSRRLNSLAGCFRLNNKINSLDDIELDEFENKRNILKLIKAHKNDDYYEWLHSLQHYSYSKDTYKFDKQEKVKFEQGVNQKYESFLN